MSIFKKEQIYVSTHISKAWDIIKGDHSVKIVTIVYERKFLKFHFFSIKQFIPLCKNPYYDGEYTSNEGIIADAMNEKANAQMWIGEYVQIAENIIV